MHQLFLEVIKIILSFKLSDPYYIFIIQATTIYF